MVTRSGDVRFEEDEEERDEDELSGCDNDIDNGDDEKSNVGFTLGSRRRYPPKQTMNYLEDGDFSLDESSDEGDCIATTVRFQVPDKSSSPPCLKGDELCEDDDSTSNSLNYTTKRLNQVCEAACLDILLDWENSLTNNNVESKTLLLPPTSPAINGGGENKTEQFDMASWGHVRPFQTSPSKGQKPFMFYAQLAKDLLEVVVFTVFFLSMVYLAWVFSKVWYMQTTRNSQDAIYPVLRTMRITSLAFLFNYPNAQELYEEACILQNPFYEMNDVSCWPCENVRHMLDFTGFSNFTSGYYQSGIPFIVKDALAKGVKFDNVYGLLKEDLTSNLTKTAHLISNHPEMETFDQLHDWNRKRDLNQLSGRGLHVAWKVNRAQYARLMRTVFQRPYYIPQETEISVQHFLFIDEPDVESYPLPITEFANVFLMQGDGPRLVVLVPVRHCQNVCKPIRVLLEPKDVLYYNWLFWRPIISPVKTTGIAEHSLSITYMGSFY